MSGKQALSALWRAARLPPDGLQRALLAGADPVVPSSFAVGAAAQAAIAAAALAAIQIGQHRGGPGQTVRVDMREAALECFCRFTVNGSAPELWDKLAGVYACRSGGESGGSGGAWVRVHTNFAHHRDGLLKLLGLPQGAQTTREQVALAVLSWDAFALEEAAAQQGVLVAACRTAAEWQAHPQRAALAECEVVDIEKIDDAPPLLLPALESTAAKASQPLCGLRVLELTRILAGPVAGRTLAAYGADVLLLNSPHLPNIDAIIDTSRGKLSAHADLRKASDRAAFDEVLAQAHVFMQGYRPGSLAALGYDAASVAKRRPGIVMVSLSAYGETGPWANPRGFDSLVQTACGFNHDEAAASNANTPRALPMQILDMASGFLMAFGAQAALLRQQREGGSWHVRVSLARTAQWLREFGRIADGFNAPDADFTGLVETSASGYGELTASRPSARLSLTPAVWTLPSMPPGSHGLRWPDR